MQPVARDTELRFEGQSAHSFDVVCVGEAFVHLSVRGDQRSMRATSVGLRHGSGALNVAVALARRGLRVGLSTSVDDDMHGRALVARVAELGIDVSGVTLAAPRTGLVVVHGSGVARELVAYRDEERPFTVPTAWSSQVLLLSGVSPVLAQSAALCKAARAARRAGTTVVIDLNARHHAWAGREPRSIRSLLREADIVRCSADDLAALRLDPRSLREFLRTAAVLVTRSGTGETTVTGPFGEMGATRHDPGALWPMGAGDAFCAAMCAELCRAPHGASGDIWARVLRRGAEAVERERVA
jgi:2-dehydro-3-deoxygluconokinase